MTNKRLVLPNSVSPIELAAGIPAIEVPDIIEFVVSDKYLNRPNLYPRQATMLKAIFLQDAIFTLYDYSVIEEWSEGFTLNPSGEGADGVYRYDGYNGCQPDLLQRIYLNQEAGRKWFRECVIVIGRRGGKGYLGALCGAYVLWNYLALGDPQGWYGVDRDKKLTGLIFAGKKAQAKTEQFADLVNVVLGSNCFAPYISEPQAESLTIAAPHDVIRQQDLERKGIKSDRDMASFQLIPKEATLMAGRGPASFIQYYDELAHVSKSNGASATSEEVYESSTPSLDQFKQEAFIFEGSSPWQMLGQFYKNWKQALEVDPRSKVPIYPEKFMLQLESWDPYKDWNRATSLKMRKGFKRCFAELKGSMQEYDDNMKKLERANPETFAIERRSRWASSLDAYLNPDRIKEMFGLWHDQPLDMKDRGSLHIVYSSHVDPSKSGKNTALAIAHVEGPDEGGFNHVVFDLIKHWEPGDFPDNDNQIDYIFIQKWLEEHVIDAFMPNELTFDQFDASIIQRLRAYSNSKERPKRINVYERTATKPLNWRMAEAFKTAMGLGLLHAPYYSQAEQELIFLQDVGHERVDHPTEGEVQSKDVYDAMANVTYALIGEQMAAFLGQEFSEFGLQGSMAGGGQAPFSKQMSEDNQAAELFSQFGQMKRGNQLSRQSPSRGVHRDTPNRHNPSAPWNR